MPGVAFQKGEFPGGWPGGLTLVPEVSGERHPGDVRGLETVGGKSVKAPKQNKRLHNLTQGDGLSPASTSQKWLSRAGHGLSYLSCLRNSSLTPAALFPFLVYHPIDLICRAVTLWDTSISSSSPFRRGCVQWHSLHNWVWSLGTYRTICVLPISTTTCWSASLLFMLPHLLKTLFPHFSSG